MCNKLLRPFYSANSDALEQVQNVVQYQTFTCIVPKGIENTTMAARATEAINFWMCKRARVDFLFFFYILYTTSVQKKKTIPPL